MDNKNLFKEAIADAKAVREAALANAKAALEEALTPKLQSMLAAKLNEMEEIEEDDSYEEDGKMKEGFTSSHDENSDANLDFNLEEDENLEEEFDLSEILAELDEDNSLEEAKEEDKDEKKKKKMMKEADDESEEETEEVADMTVEDLKALIKDLIAQEMGGEDAGEEAGEEMSMDMGSEETSAGGEPEDEINLDELLAELDALDETKEEETKESIEEGVFDSVSAFFDSLAGGGKMKDYKACREELKGQNLGMEEMIKALKQCVEKRAPGSVTAQPHTAGMAFGVKENSELEEAIDTINTLRSELNEVNLLNAKLLYVNKIFKAKNLSESQKLQVISSFDKATTVKEAKVVFESLNTTLTATAPKKQIKESLGFASKAAGVAPKKAIVESDDVITRMQKLANIIK